MMNVDFGCVESVIFYTNGREFEVNFFDLIDEGYDGNEVTSIDDPEVFAAYARDFVNDSAKLEWYRVRGYGLKTFL